MVTRDRITKALIVIVALVLWSYVVVVFASRQQADYSYRIDDLESQIDHLRASLSELEAAQPSPAADWPRAAIPRRTDDVEIEVSGLRAELHLAAAEAAAAQSDVVSLRAEIESKLRRMESDAALRR